MIDDDKPVTGAAATDENWETDTMVHKHLATKRRKSRKRLVSPALVVRSESDLSIMYEAQAEGNKWVTLERKVTLDALMQSVNPSVLAAKVINGMASKAIDKCYETAGAPPTHCVSISIKLGRYSIGFRCNDDAINWLTAIVIGGRYYDDNRIDR